MDKKYLQLVWLRGYGTVKADAQNSYLGTLWWVLDPILMSALLYLAFSTGLRGSGGADFFIFLIFGMIPLKWTQSCLQSSASVLIRNKGLLGQVYFPKWVFPTFNMVSQSIRFLFAVPILLVVSIFFVQSSSHNDWLLILIILVQLFLNFGISYCFSSVLPIIPDLSHVVPVFSMGLMFTSGVFFDIETRPEEIRSILELNPLVDIIKCYRNVLLHDNPIFFSDLQYPLIFSIFALTLGLIVLRLFDRIYPRII